MKAPKFAAWLEGVERLLLAAEANCYGLGPTLWEWEYARKAVLACRLEWCPEGEAVRLPRGRGYCPDISGF